MRLSNHLLLLQDLSASDVTSFVTIKEITISGLLIFAIYILYRKFEESQKKIDELGGKTDNLRDKYADELKVMRDENIKVLIKNNDILDKVTQLVEKVMDILDDEKDNRRKRSNAL